MLRRVSAACPARRIERYIRGPGQSPDKVFPAPPWSFPGKAEFAVFLDNYAKEWDLPVRSGVTVSRLSYDGIRFLLDPGGSCYVARNVVVAAGYDGVPKTPEFAINLDPGIVQLHSAAYRNPQKLREGSVLVVEAVEPAGVLVLLPPFHPPHPGRPEDAAIGCQPQWTVDSRQEC